MSRFRRDWFTDEVEELPTETSRGRSVIARIEHPFQESVKTGDSFWRRGWRSTSMAVQPSQALEFTKLAHESGNTDVEYCTKTGDMIAHSEDGRQAEWARRGHYDPNSSISKYVELVRRG